MPSKSHFDALKPHLGGHRRHLGPSASHLGLILAHFGPSWPQFGPILDHLVRILGSSGPQLGTKEFRNYHFEDEVHEHQEENGGRRCHAVRRSR